MPDDVREAQCAEVHRKVLGQFEGGGGGIRALCTDGEVDPQHASGCLLEREQSVRVRVASLGRSEQHTERTKRRPPPRSPTNTVYTPAAWTIGGG